MLISTLVFSCVLAVAWTAEDSQRDLSFPPSFQFGVASSSYQIEGAWDSSGKGESVWDRFVHSKHNSMSYSTGDVACDSYRLWRRDVEMVHELGVNFYRFSISWPRILPKGFTNVVSEEGTKHYSDLIDELLLKNIEPIVTLYHWDLPQRLQDLGGWTNPLVSSWFADYARVVFSLYGDRVKTWITVNEPQIACTMQYNGHMAPGIVSSEGSMLCSKHILMAHAKAWRVYDEEFRGRFHGRVSFANYLMWFEPITKEDVKLAASAQQHLTGLYSHPVFSKEGGWPPLVEKLIADNSKELGYPRSTLPSLSKVEVELLKGTHDFYAFNFYTSRTIQKKSNKSEVLQPWPVEDAPLLNAKLGIDPTWEITASSYYPKNPVGIRKMLRWLKEEYGDMPIMLAENGFASKGGLEDRDRIRFFKEHLQQILLAINEDGVNVTAFTVWSLMDSFEWTDGYNTKFGLYEVDFSSPARNRTPRASAFYYTSVIRSRSLAVSGDITVQASIEASSSGYIIIGGVLLAVVFVALGCLIMKRRHSAVKETYTGLQTEEMADRGL